MPRFGQLLCGLVDLGLTKDDITADWAGGWLAYHLKNRCWDKWIKDDPEWAVSLFNTRYLNFSGPIDYDLPRVLVLLGARKYATPAWGKENGSAWHYAKQIRDPELRKIIISADVDE